MNVLKSAPRSQRADVRSKHLTHTAMQRGFRLPVRWLFLFGSPLPGGGLAGGCPMAQAQGRAQPRSRLGAGGRMGPLLLPLYMAKLA